MVSTPGHLRLSGLGVAAASSVGAQSGLGEVGHRVRGPEAKAKRICFGLRSGKVILTDRPAGCSYMNLLVNIRFSAWNFGLKLNC